MILAIEAGLTIEKFWRLTWREFLLYRKGFEARELNEWNRARFVAYQVYVNVTKYEKNRIGIKEFLPLPSDEKEERILLTQEEFIENMKRFSKAI